MGGGSISTAHVDKSEKVSTSYGWTVEFAPSHPLHDECVQTELFPNFLSSFGSKQDVTV